MLMSVILIYVDASVLIYAIVGKNAGPKTRALSILADPARAFVATEFLRLELLPIPTYFNRQREVAFYERYFKAVSMWIDPNSIVQIAFDLACKHGLGAMDALHLAAAISAGAEFVSAEKPTKPIYSAYSKAVSIH